MVSGLRHTFAQLAIPVQMFEEPRPDPVRVPDSQLEPEQLISLAIERSDVRLVYDFNASISLIIESNENSGTLWQIESQLAIEMIDTNICKFQLRNIRTNVFNGPFDNYEREFFDLQFDDENRQLENEFVVTYAENGLIASFEFRNDSVDSVWVRNFKKSILAVFQFDRTRVHQPISFVTEDSLYGICDRIEYFAFNQSSTRLVLEKIADNSNCSDSYDENRFSSRKWSNLPIFECGERNVPTITTNTIRRYELNRERRLEIETVSSRNEIIVQPFLSSGSHPRKFDTDNYRIVTMQVFVLRNRTETDREPLERESESGGNEQPQKYHSLSYEIKESQDFTTNGRRKTDGMKSAVLQSQLLRIIRLHIEKLVDNFDQLQLKTPHETVPMFGHQNETFSTLMFLMTQLTDESFSQLYDDFAIGTSYQHETKMHIFLELLPQIGTKSSLRFLKSLILAQNLSDLRILKILVTYPFYVLEPSESLLNEFRFAFDLKNSYASDIRSTALLSFATFVSRTFRATKCSRDLFKEYVRNFLQLFLESQNYADQMIYIQCLLNMNHEIVQNYLAPIISGEQNRSHHLRFLAAFSSLDDHRTTDTNANQVFELYWPIFKNQTEHFEMRIVAILMLLKSNPTPSRLLAIYWHLNLKHGHFYNFFYTTLVFLQESKHPCYRDLQQMAAKFLRLFKQPKTNRFWITGNYQIDSIDKSNQFGSLIQLILIANPLTDRLNIFYGRFENYFSNIKSNQFAVYLKLNGLNEGEQKLFEKMFRVRSEAAAGAAAASAFEPPPLKFDRDRFEKIFENNRFPFRQSQSIHFELILQMQSKTIYCKYLNSTTFNETVKELERNFFAFLADYHINYQNIEIPMINKNLLISDIGTPIHLVDMISTISSFRANFTYEQESRREIITKHDLDFRYHSFAHKWICIYNPLNDIYHGIDKSKTFYSQFFSNNELEIDLKQSKQFRFRTKRLRNKPIGLVVTYKTISFMETSNELNAALMSKRQRKFVLTRSAPNEIQEDRYAYNVSDLNAIVYVKTLGHDRATQQQLPLTLLNLFNYKDNIHLSHNYNLILSSYFQLVSLICGTNDYVNLLRSQKYHWLSVIVDLAGRNSSEILFEIEPAVSMLNIRSGNLNFRIDFRMKHSQDNRVANQLNIHANLNYCTMQPNKSFEFHVQKSSFRATDRHISNFQLKLESEDYAINQATRNANESRMNSIKMVANYERNSLAEPHANFANCSMPNCSQIVVQIDENMISTETKRKCFGQWWHWWSSGHANNKRNCSLCWPYFDVDFVRDFGNFSLSAAAVAAVPSRRQNARTATDEISCSFNSWKSFRSYRESSLSPSPSPSSPPSSSSNSNFEQKWLITMQKIPYWILIRLEKYLDVCKELPVISSWLIGNKQLVDQLKFAMEQSFFHKNLSEMTETARNANNFDLVFRQRLASDSIRNFYYESLFDFDILSFVLIRRNRVLTINQNLRDFASPNGSLVHCTKNSKFAFNFDNRNLHNLSFTLQIPSSDSLTVFNANDSIQVMFNNRKLTNSETNATLTTSQPPQPPQSPIILYSHNSKHYYELFVYSPNSIAIYNTYSEIRIFYTFDSVFVIVPSYYKGFLCGIGSQ